MVCEGMADEPVPDLDNRTPLELAKTPWMDSLAKKGRVGFADFSPRSLPPSPEVACFSILGFDARQFYTGLGPLEALARGVPQEDGDLVFRCNLVTVMDEVLVDATSGHISSKEAVFLIEALNERLSNESLRFYPNRGYRNILWMKDSEGLEEMECLAPKRLLGQNYSKVLPRVHKTGRLAELVEASKAILENQEINRVRIDLKENPANLVWLWGQGKPLKIPSFRQRTGLAGAAFCNVDFAKGLAKAVDLEIKEDKKKALDGKEFVFIHVGHETGMDQSTDLKSKIKWIEDFDALVGQVIRDHEHEEALRIGVTTDCAGSLSKKILLHGHVPFVIQGSGISADGIEVFNEKNASQSQWLFAEGAKLMETFLK